MKNLNTKIITYSRKGEIVKVEIVKGIDKLLFEYNYYKTEYKTGDKYIVITQDDGITIKRQNEKTLCYDVYEEIYVINGGLE